MAGEIGTIADGFPGSSRGRGVAMFSKGNKRKEKDLRGKGKEEKREWKMGVMRARGERTERSQKKKGPKRRTRGTAALEKLRLGETTP